MRVVYDSKTIEQVFNLLNSLTVQGIQNNSIIAGVSTLLQKNKIEDETYNTKDAVNDGVK